MDVCTVIPIVPAKSTMSVNGFGKVRRVVAVVVAVELAAATGLRGVMASSGGAERIMISFLFICSLRNRTVIASTRKSKTTKPYNDTPISCTTKVALVVLMIIDGILVVGVAGLSSDGFYY
jgi:hypothetical protein